MPTRLIREGLIHSQAYLSLKDNADRCAYVALLLSVDDFGNMEAAPYRLLRLFRDYGINTDEKVAQCLSALQDTRSEGEKFGLISLYTDAGKRFLHVWNTRQDIRYFKRIVPVPPWQKELYQLVKEKKLRLRDATATLTSEDVDVDVDVDKKAFAPEPVNKSGDKSTGRTFADFWKAKGKDLLIESKQGESDKQYIARVRAMVKDRTV